MLGWLRVTGIDGVDRDFYVRQLWDSKGSAVVETMKPQSMTTYAQLCGWALAKSARALRRRDRDRQLPRQDRRARPGARLVRRGLRRPERTRLRGAPGSGGTGRVKAETGL